MAKLITALVLLIALAAPVMGQTVKQPQEPPENKVIPPDILRQMDPGLRYNTRPKIEVIRQNDIFGLREKPRRDADVVTFEFERNKLSTAQRNILDAWIRAGHNKIYLHDYTIPKYAGLFGATAYSSQNEVARGANTAPDSVIQNASARRLHEHVVNTDCHLAYFGSDYKAGPPDSRRRHYVKYYYFTFSEPLPNGTETIAEAGKNRVVCGAFTYGRARIYFLNQVRGPDKRRWHLNFWHWVLDLRVPGASETGAIAGGPIGPSGVRRPVYDAIKLKNGDTMSGVILNESFTIKASYGVLTFPRAHIDRITIEGGGFNVDELILVVGDRISGVLQDAKIRVKLTSGAEVELDKDKVKEIQIRYEEVDAEATEGSQKDGR